MDKFKFFKKGETDDFFSNLDDGLTFDFFYEMLNNSELVEDKAIAFEFRTKPIDFILTKYDNFFNENLIEQFKEWRRYNGEWWREDEDIQQYLDGIENSEEPNQDAPKLIKFISKGTIQLESFTIKERCEGYKNEFLNLIMDDKVKFHFKKLPDGIEVTIYL